MGFVKVPHDLLDWEWFDSKNTVYVYLKLLLKANWEEGRQKGVPVERGQVVISQREFANDCKISRGELRLILDRLTSAHKIDQSTTHKFSLITLIEYDCTAQSTAQTMYTNVPGINPPTLLNKKEKNKRDQENARAREDKTAESEALNKSFDLFWEKYPRKTAKQQALSAWRKLKPDEKLVERIIAAIDKHKRSTQWTQDNGQFVPYPATWLNGRRWEDEITEVKDNVTRSGTKADEVDWYAGF